MIDFMAPPHKFTVAFDSVRMRLSWTMRGFWDVTDVAAFGTALREALKPIGPPPLHFDSLSDAREFPVQSREVANALSAIERAGAAMRIGRVAIVVGSMMNKLQAQRSLGPNVRTFMAIADAEDWLDELMPSPASST
jgi:hypothetical protein